MTYPLAHLCERWLAKIELARQLKEERFGCYAKESYAFFNGPSLHMFDKFRSDNKGLLGEQLNPTFKMSVNRIFEAVALYGPALVQDYPQITVEPVKRPWALPDDPMEAAKMRCAAYKQYLGNWVQVEGEKKDESRLVITEAIVKGMGLMWTEMYQPPGSSYAYPRSSFVSVDRLLVDPDATHQAGIQWIALRHVEPVHVVETKFNLKPGSLKGHMQSGDGQTSTFGQQDATRGFGQSYDLIEYYDIYSKSGFGEKLKKDSSSFLPDIDTDQFGDFCRIVVAKGCKYPLNLSPDAMHMQSMEPSSAVSWPIPYWMDGGWPYTPLGFIQDPNSVWPVGICKNGLGYLKFINWCMSFLADRIAGSANVYMAMQKHAAKDIKDQLVGQYGPIKVIELEQAAGKNINEVISILAAPNAEYETWKMIEEASERFDKSTGLTDIMYAATGGMRTATEADVKSRMSSIRPDDMAATTDDFLSKVAKKEIQALCWAGQPEFFQSHLGPEAAMDFMEYLSSSPPDAVVREYYYRVASDSVRRPNKAAKRKDMVELVQQIIPGILQFAAMGMTGPWNGLMQAMGDSYDLDSTPFMVPEFVPPEQQAAEDEKRKEEEKPEPTPGSMTNDAMPPEV
jgi:hypothetical protein